MPFRKIDEKEIAATEPTTAVVSEILPGTEKVKDPLTEGQKRQANFAIRMENALRQLEELEDSGFNPVNVYDIAVNNLPFVPDAIERFLSSPKYKQYERAKLDFSTAQLRQETGAVINDSEIVWINKTYFPEFGDDEGTMLAKRQARRDAYAGMKGQAGKAYERTKKEVEKFGGSATAEDALKELLERAKTDPELKAKLQERGLL
tara:strand:+ start:2487 stop:3101 length:615 start_codon:yes stop_codon:yes gene_type:complete